MLPFSGKQEDWFGWEENFKARAMSRGYYGIMMGEESIPEHGLKLDATKDKEKIDLRKLNATGYQELLSCINFKDGEGKRVFDLILSSKSKEFPMGNIKDAYEALKQRFAPVKTVLLGELENKLFASSLSKGENPEEFVIDLENVRAQMAEMGSTITDDQFLRRVIMNLTGEYGLVNKLLGGRVGDATNPLTIDEVKAMVKRMHQQALMEGKLEKEEEEEQVLAMGTFKGFKGRCHGCGKIGHRKYECPDENGQNKGGNNNFGNGGFRGTCFYCGKKGHSIKFCHKKMNDEKNRDEGGQSQKDDEEEMMLVTIDEFEVEGGSNQIGYCPNCNGCGTMHTWCIVCEDQGFTHSEANRKEMIDGDEDDEDEKRMKQMIEQVWPFVKHRQEDEEE